MEVHDGEEITIKDLSDTPKVEEAKHKDIFDLEWKKMNKKAITYTRPNSNFQDLSILSMHYTLWVFKPDIYCILHNLRVLGVA